MLGGFASGQAEYLWIPHSDVGPIRITSNIADEKVLFLSAIFPTAYRAAQDAEIGEGDAVAIWGGGPVGQLAVEYAWMLGAGRVILIEHVPERLAMASAMGKAETIDFLNADVHDRLQQITNGRGPDRCIDAVGAEAHGTGSFDAVLDKAKAAVTLATDRPQVLRQATFARRKGGSVSVPGVYVGLLDKCRWALR